jgi:S-layer homology domain
MKKKSTSHSAFLNLRVLFGLLVMLAGVFLALVSFGPATKGFAQGTTREQMTLTLAQALNIFQPPPCVPGAEIFNDVPASSPFCPYIEEMARRGITTGCAPGLFCPRDFVTRQQMAVFVVRIVGSEAFHIVGDTGEPPFENGWTNFGGGRTTAGFYIDSQNVVHLKGSITGGASGTTAFTLPPGYRPAATLLLPVSSGSFVIVVATLQSDGTLHPFCSGGCVGSVGLDGLSFRVGTGGASAINGSPSAASTGLTPDG